MSKIDEAICKLCNRDCCYESGACDDADALKVVVCNIIESIHMPCGDKEHMRQAILNVFMGLE